MQKLEKVGKFIKCIRSNFLRYSIPDLFLENLCYSATAQSNRFIQKAGDRKLTRVPVGTCLRHFKPPSVEIFKVKVRCDITFETEQVF